MESTAPHHVGQPRLSDPGETCLQQAVAASLFAAFPPALRDQLLVDALPAALPAGSVIYRDEVEPRCALVVAGLVRVFLSAPDGRTVTVRYARSGELLGVPTIIGGPAPTSAQMLTDAELLMLNARTLRRLYETLEAVAVNAFGSLRQRVARHLLDLATRQRGGRLVAAVTQQELAEAVGSSRPAVARVVAELRAARLIATSARGIAILDAEGLHGETWSRDLSPM